MTVSRSSRPEMPWARALETAARAMVKACGDSPGTPCAKAVVAGEAAALGAGARTVCGTGAALAAGTSGRLARGLAAMRVSRVAERRSFRPIATGKRLGVMRIEPPRCRTCLRRARRARQIVVSTFTTLPGPGKFRQIDARV